MALRMFALLPGLVACGGVGGSTDIDSTLLFADLDDVQIARLVAAASAGEGFAAQGQVSQFDDPFGDGDPCPTVVEDAANLTVTITGGCTRVDDESRIEGTVVIDNPLGWGELDYDFTRSSTYEFDGFSIDFGTPGAFQSWDGVFTTEQNFGGFDMDLTTDQLGVAVRSDLFLDCNSTECEHGESGLELVGVGGARVSGTIGVAGQTAVGSLTLRGQDTVKVTIGGGCIRWELVGTDRSMAQGSCQ